MDALRELHLFAGAGGGILAGQMLGHTCVCAVEYEPYAQSVLVARQNDGSFPPFPIWDDVRSFDGKPWRGIVDVVAGGFPCQDISAAGKGAGITGARSGLWTEFARIISEVRPRYAFIENSPMLVARGLDTVLCDLAKMGYDAEWCVLSAAQVGANHKRERIWILATDASGERWNERCDNRQERHVLHDQIRNASQGQSERQGRQCGFGEASTDVANANLLGCDDRQTKINTTKTKLNAQCNVGSGGSNVADARCKHGSAWEFTDLGACKKERASCAIHAQSSSAKLSNANRPHGERNERTERGYKKPTLINESSWWQVEPNLDRVADGVAFRSHRLKAIGNGQVPLCAATAFQLLKERITRGETK